MSPDLKIDRRITPAYEKVFKELSDKSRYRTWSVAGFYCDAGRKPDLDRVNVIVRVDVDNGFHLTVPLAEALSAYGIQSTHYFLTRPDRYYKIWGSEIPARVAQLGHEVGLHTDHLYEQIVSGTDGLAALKQDVRRLSEEAGSPVRGMVYHGHTAIDALGRTNWELTKDLPSKELGLEYHDGLRSCYIKPGASRWEPACDVRMTDWLGFPDSWGWNYYPAYPLQLLREARPGQVVHLAFHTRNAFRYWEDWTDQYGEKKSPREPWRVFWRKALSIRWRYGILKGHSLAGLIFQGVLSLVSFILAKGVGVFWPRPGDPEPDTSWETGRERIFAQGLDYWRGELERFGLVVPGGVAVEVGSGNGQWLLAFARDAEKVIGVEPGEVIREYSIKKIAEYPEWAEKIEVRPGSAESLPVEDGIADAVMCAGVFMFTRQDEALGEMHRILKPDGKLCVTVNGLGYFLMYILNGFRYKSQEKMSYGLGGLGATLAQRFLGRDLRMATAVSYQEMKGHLERHGFILEDTRIWLPEVAPYPRKHLGWVTNYAFIAKKSGDSPPSPIT